MTRFSFAHLADLHLDTPFQGLRNRNPELAAALEGASLDAWDRAVDACLDAGVDFVVIAGDVYDGENAGARAQLRFRDGLARLSAAGVPSFVVHGNHDPRGGRWSAIKAWPEAVTVFGHDEVTSVPVARAGEELALVHGISYATPQVTENLAARFRRNAAFPGFQLGLLHANIDGRGGHANYAPATLADLRQSGLDYWALGHVHARTIICAERPLAAYPGNLQARHPNETGEKGFLQVDVVEGVSTTRFVPVDLVRFETVSLDIGELGDLQEVQDELIKAALTPAERALVLRADLHGSGPSHADLAKAGEDGLLEYLRDVAPARVWWDEVRLLTRPALDRAARLQAGDFVADLLRVSDEGRLSAAEAVEKLVEELAQHPQLRAVAAQLDLDGLIADGDGVWNEAETLAYDLIDAGQAGG